MDSAQWVQPVMIVCKKSGQLYTITNTREALDMLLRYWPVSDGKAFFDAMEVCIGVAEGRASKEQARQAFIDAAHEALIPVEIPDVIRVRGLISGPFEAAGPKSLLS
ncbi:DUF982 domain-containing protein [Rhizobium azibense]|uniref:Uncharacterized protein DUF982 n=1 Tax=Rhizobium azibense TaxID=1136135 RepID=A0A4R3RA65_9HYPH|nr:DUF982 domain-containing protein [Rhizobium azibense]TCU32270.1 uncharacterized protein DUF982 [Rhizobium azibense]